MIAPSNSGPRPVLMVVGDRAFHKMDSQMFVAMNSEMPLEIHQQLDDPNQQGTRFTFLTRNPSVRARPGG